MKNNKISTTNVCYGGGQPLLNKGFTLIELLAVIVILAIIALIATPIVLNIIKDSKENTIKISAENYLSALDNSIALNKEKIKDNTYDIIDKGNICLEYNSTGCINELKLKVEGTIPESGTITIEKGIVVGYELVYREKIIKKYSNGKQTIEENPYKEVKDDNPRIICGEGTTEDLSLEVCHIRSIEDLVAFSNPSDKSIDFSNKTIKLVNSLDFKNKNSYVSGKVDNSLITGVGFKPIGTFKGTFEGNNNKIKNLYINKPADYGIGLFSGLQSGTIQNLTIDKAYVIGKGNFGALLGSNNGGTIQNINVYNTKAECFNKIVGSLVGTNSGTIQNIKIDNISIVGSYVDTAGLIGYNTTTGVVDNIELNNISVVNETSRGSGLVGTNEGTIQNIKASNINIKSSSYSGGLIETNKGVVKQVEIENVEVEGTGTNIGGLIGFNSGELVENIKLKNIKIIAKNRSGGLVGANNTTGIIKKITGNNIEVNGTHAIGGLIGINDSGIIEQIKLIELNIKGSQGIGGLVGDNRTIDIIKDIKLDGTVKGISSLGLLIGSSNKLSLNNVVAKGNIEGTSNNIGGLVGSVGSTSEANANISGVYLSGDLVFKETTTNNRMIGNKGSYSPVFKLLSSDKVTINGNKVESNDISSVDGKTLLDIGKASQSEYETIGFEFESTDTNECYWYFDENDELDLKIK